MLLPLISKQPDDLNRLNVLHITGTKGKGSTSAFVSSLLTTVAPQAKVGLYTSPHLVAVRERIRINGVPIDEALFAKYFWEVWDRLEANTAVRPRFSLFLDFSLIPSAPFQTADPDTSEKPAYFRYLTIMAMHVFLAEKVRFLHLFLTNSAQLYGFLQVDATILEVGVGGTYDSTNVVPSPITTGVTALGIDHIWVLGKTIPEIAAQKGGIYKVRVFFSALVTRY